MKRTGFFACIALAYGIAMPCFAQTAEKVSIQHDLNSGIFKIVYKTSTPENVKIHILNDKGETIFTESLLKTLSFSRPYNFNDQPSGSFKIILEDQEGRTERKVSYAIQTVESVIEVSRIANAPSKYLLSVENKEPDLIQVRILDGEKTLLHDESIFVNGKFAVVYNLNKLKTSPTFEVAGSDGVWKTFNFQ